MSAAITTSLPTARRGVLATLSHNPLAVLGGVLLLMVILAALFAPALAPFDPFAQRIAFKLRPPSARNWLGTDALGRDVLSRILFGARVSLLVGLSSVALAMVVGGALGIVAGFRGGWTDFLVSRAMDVLLTFPTLVMGVLVLALAGPSQGNLILAIGLTLTPKFARVARAPTLAATRREYIAACRVLGYSDRRIMAVHILPNVLGDILAMAALWAALAILTEASLSFIGLGPRPPTATWGGMMREGFENLADAPWLCLYPGAAILITVLALNLVGDGLRDAIDPKLRDQ
jgi:peptide/nickel transport system permease protein